MYELYTTAKNTIDTVETYELMTSLCHPSLAPVMTCNRQQVGERRREDGGGGGGGGKGG